jgi:hypothetical protein
MTNGGAPGDDFEAAKVVFEKLKDLPPDRQERVLQSVAEGLGVPLTAPKEPGRAPVERGFVEPPRPPTSQTVQARRASYSELMASQLGFPYQTLPPNVVMKILAGSRGSTITRWAHLKSKPGIRLHVRPRSGDRQAEASKPAA